ncbi:MAG TPA: thioredoxin fold domain-containing protein [Candidatus Eisenbacteria bacterium]|nr:thioredoxin fold domain-containing protein [Candidatus Eisenbacteria bacterium]
MDFRIQIAMRARAALLLFLASIVAGGLAVFAAALVTDPSLAASKTVKAGAKPSAKPTADAPAEVHWRALGDALTEAKSSNKIIVADVYTDWCGWCRRMDKDTYAKPEVQSYLDKSFVPVRLNAEADTRVHYAGGDYTYRELAAGFRITGYPTTLFLAPDGKHLATAPGYMKAEDFLSVLRYFGDGHYKNQSFQDYEDQLEAAASPGSPATPPTDPPHKDAP